MAKDPGRRDRIAEAALGVIIERGVHRTTHRVIAQRAGVPLGSLTYHFEGLEQILEEAFTLLVEQMSAHYRTSLETATSPHGAYEAVADLICGEGYGTAPQMTALFEMYAFGNHNEVVATLCREWMSSSRESLSLHLSEPAQRAVDVLVEGWGIHRAFEGAAPDRELVLRTVRAAAEAAEAAEDRPGAAMSHPSGPAENARAAEEES